MSTAGSGRGSFGSGAGFILAAAGSAIGLGNIWGFPFMAAQSGGGAFVVLYLLCVVLIGVPVLFSELAIGRSSRKSPVGAFKKLAPGTPWLSVGAMGVAIGFAILAFYSVIAGWTLGYLAKSVSGQFARRISMAESERIFDGFTGQPLPAIAATLAFFLLTMVVVRGGVRSGIERISKILMPVFFLLLVGIALRSLTLDTEMVGLRFLFRADLTKITPTVVLNALAQALFSLSLGMGAMITYGSYVSREENLVKSGIIVASFDTLIALLAGVMIFPALAAAGVDLTSPQVQAGDAGLVFKVLPTIFDTLPAGGLFAVAFYLLLSIAALTSSISLLEVVVSYFVDERGWSRDRSTWLLGTACFLLAVPCAISGQQVLGMQVPNVMGFLIQVFYIYLLAIGALLICVFAGWKWGVLPAAEELAAGGGSKMLIGIWSVLIRFVCPVVTAIVLGQRLWGLIAPMFGS